MRLRTYLEQEPAAQQPRVRAKAKRPSITGHGAFVPMLTAWGAAVFGLVLVVLPDATIARITALGGLAGMGGTAKYIFVGVAACLGGGLAFVIASALRDRAKAAEEKVSVISAVSTRRVRPINPASDLGSDSLDAPIEEMPFGAQFDKDDDAAEEGEFEEFYADLDGDLDADNGADLDGDLNGGAASAPEKPARQPTLGELSQRGYDIEEPENYGSGGGAKDGNDKPAGKSGFTRSHFKSALIETCEGATCEAAPGFEHAEGNSGDAKPEPQAQSRQQQQQQQQAPAAPKPLGRPGAGGGSWSLTQFAPDTAANAQAAEKPRALDLAEFAELPGRNAVWVEEQAAPTPTPATASTPETTTASMAASPARPARPRPVPATSALEKLRQTPPEDLSLVQMVERFAAALHDHQNAERARLPRSGAGRDAALAEALKALTLFTERGFNQSAHETAPVAANAADEGELGQTERELREALVKLQNLRGAA